MDTQEDAEPVAPPLPDVERIIIAAQPKPERWHFERHNRGVVEEYSITDWVFRVGFFLFGLVLGWLLAHAGM